MVDTSETLFDALPESIRRSIGELGWKRPMPVQEKVIPEMRDGHDLIVKAQTGSGKTGAFGIPLVVDLDAEKKTCQALVMTPTRELANQVAAEIETLGRHKGIRCLPIYGGVGYAQQLEGIEAGFEVIVGTPGRILDHLGSGRLQFDDVRVLVVDEADELLSLGFWPDMREINKYLPKDRQSCLFSATIPEKVRSLSRVFLRDPVFVSLSEDQASPQQIEHFFIVTTAQEKEANLVRIIEQEDPESAIIFCNTKDDVRYITSYLQRRGFDADQISGDLSRRHRRGGTRNRHQRPHPRDQLRGTRLARGVRAPHGTHRTRGKGRDRHLAGLGPRHRKLPLPAAGQQDRDRGAQAPERRRSDRAAGGADLGEGRAGGARARRSRAARADRALHPDREVTGRHRGRRPRPGRALRLLPARAPARDHRHGGRREEGRAPGGDARRAREAVWLAVPARRTQGRLPARRIARPEALGMCAAESRALRRKPIP
jgi:hypothetical protein